MQADERDSGMRHDDTLPWVDRFLALCERYGSEESANGRCRAGPARGLAGVALA